LHAPDHVTERVDHAHPERRESTSDAKAGQDRRDRQTDHENGQADDESYGHAKQ
jgi:hypothetical protein